MPKELMLRKNIKVSVSWDIYDQESIVILLFLIFLQFLSDHGNLVRSLQGLCLPPIDERLVVPDNNE